MKKKNQTTFKQLLLTSLLSSLLLGLSGFFLAGNEKSLTLILAASITFMIVFLTIMCWMYKINPFKKSFESPYTND